jgi:putative flavoprotein involved in K+ transport
VYFAGLPFAISRRSGTILAIAEEAALFVKDIQRRLDTCH